MRLTDYVVLCVKKAWIRQMPGDTGSDVWTGMVFYRDSTAQTEKKRLPN